jgi:hypothetical protein
VQGTVTADATGQARANVEVTRTADGTDVKQSNGKKP